MTTRSKLLHTFAALLFACALAPPIAAQAEPDGQSEAQPESQEQLSYQEQIDRFFTGLTEGEYGKTLEQIYAGNPWIAADDLEQVRQQFESLPELIGPLHGYELVSEQHVTERFVFLWYVGHFDRSPVSLYFKFYKPEGTWRFYSFEYKEDLGQVAREMALRELKTAAGSPE